LDETGDPHDNDLAMALAIATSFLATGFSVAAYQALGISGGVFSCAAKHPAMPGGDPS